MTHGIILFHNNTHLHIVNTIKTNVQGMHWEILEHMAYSPDFSPTTFISLDAQVKQAIHNCLHKQPFKFCEKSTQHFVT